MVGAWRASTCVCVCVTFESWNAGTCLESSVRAVHAVRAVRVVCAVRAVRAVVRFVLSMASHVSLSPV